MESLYQSIGFLLVIGFALLIFNYFFAKRKQKPASYRITGPLLTPAERSFYGVLQQAVGNSYEIHAKVRVADILTPEKGLDRSKWQIAFNKISPKHFDFVLCDPNTLSVIKVIELNDSSHKKQTRRTRDEFLTAACESANLMLYTIPAKKAYSLHELRKSLGDTSVDA